jgi:hypothetical protein
MFSRVAFHILFRCSWSSMFDWKMWLFDANRGRVSGRPRDVTTPFVIDAPHCLCRKVGVIANLAFSHMIDEKGTGKLEPLAIKKVVDREIAVLAKLRRSA